jgi:hypothetical protein
MHDAKLEYIGSKRMGAERKISSVGHKLLYEIHPRLLWVAEDL